MRLAVLNPYTEIVRRNRAMLEDAERPLGTRWWGAPLMVAGLGSLAFLYQLVSSGVLAVNFTTADEEFTMYSNYVQGVASAGMLSPNRGSSPESTVGVTEIGIKQARLAGLCGISHQDVPVVGAVTVMITAGVPVKPEFDQRVLDLTDGRGGPISLDADGALTGTSLHDAVRATDLFINTTELDGYGNRISGLNLGRSADGVVADSDVNGGQWPNGQNPPAPGGFGLTAQHLNLADFDGDSYGMDMHGSITLPKLQIRSFRGEKTQADCPTEAG